MADEVGTDRDREPYDRRAEAAAAEPRVETDTYEGPDRRASEPKPSERRRWRELLNRWKDPIIGLTVAGAAAPLIHAGTAGPEAPKPQPAQAAAGSETAAAQDVPTEDVVAQQWRQAAEKRMRELTITGAQTRYDISRELARKIFDTAVDEGIEPDLAFGLVNTESTFRPQVVSSVGAQGLTQVLPRTAKWIMGAKHTPNLFDVDTNLHAGFRYLRKLIDDYEGDVRLALTAYNRGPGTVNRILSRGGNPDNGYAGRVLSE